VKWAAPAAAITPSTMIWDFRGALSLITGTPFYPMFSGTISKVRLNLQSIGSGNTVVDMLKNNVSIFPTSPRPSVVAGSLVGSPAVPDTTAFVAGDAIQFSITQTGVATGLVAAVEFVRVP